MRSTTALLAATLLLAACSGKGSDTGYARDGDTGAAAPATTRDMSQTPNVGDSTTGLTPTPGQTPTSSASGDTLHAQPHAGSAGPSTGVRAGTTKRP